jgi:hypothetical protein
MGFNISRCLDAIRMEHTYEEETEISTPHKQETSRVIFLEESKLLLLLAYLYM